MFARRPAAARPAGDPSLPLYLSLFLLLAALFLLLNSMSPREARRAEAAVVSVAQAFGGGKSRPEIARDPPGIRWAEATGVALAELLPLGTLTAATHERGARFAFTSETLFTSGEASLRAERVAMLDRLVDRLRHPPSGSRAELEIRVAAGDRLAAPRAEALARTLIGRGLPPEAMVVGMAGGGVHTIELLVATRAEPRR